MATPVFTRSSQLAALAALTATGGLLVGGKVHLYAAPLTPTPGMKLADFVEATYDGYAAQVVGTWGAPYFGIDQMAHVTAPGLQFQPTDGVVTNTIYGAYITNAGSTVLIFAVQFATPIPFVDATKGLVYEPDVVYGS